MPITLNADQLEAESVLKDPTARFILLFGATGGGKTFVIAKNIIERAEHAPGSRHLVLRSKAVDCRAMLFEQTFKDVINAKYADPKRPDEKAWDFLREKLAITIEPMAIRLPNGSQIDFRGLDDNKLDRVLGSDYSTVFISEVSLIEDYGIISSLNTRLRQKVVTVNDKLLRMKFLMDCNPPSKRHWTYPTFAQSVNFNSRLPHDNPRLYRCHKITTDANLGNLSDDYVESMAADMAGDYVRRKRFLEGLWYDEVENPLFSGNDISRYRYSPVLPGDPEAEAFARIVVSVDPAMSTHKGSDETGIIVAAEDENREFHVLEDLSGRYQPHEWGALAVDALHRWKANEIVAEVNQGGNLVVSNVAAIDANVRVVSINASRGKDIRAEASSTAYKQGRVHHRGSFQKLEDQLVEFEVGFNRRKKGYSPDRLDALVHGLNHLMGASPKRGGQQGSFSLFR